MKRITFIVNPVSGGKDKKDVLAAIDRYLAPEYSCEVLMTGKPGDAKAWARRAKRTSSSPWAATGR